MSKYLSRLRFALLLGFLGMTGLGVTAALAQAPPALGQADTFAVLGGSAVSNTGGTVLTGDLGIWPNTASSISGFPPGVVFGTTHAADAVAQQAQVDLTTAYIDLAGRACDTVLTGTDLGGLTLTPGVYCFSTSAQLTGTLTLNAQGDPNAVFIFQIGSTLTTASSARVLMTNGGSECGVFWQVGTSATIGTGTQFAGNILALSSITVTTGSSVSGRVLARNGAVSLDTNSVTLCAAGCPTITLTPSTLPNGALGSAYSQTISASGGAPPYVFSVLAGTLPPGLLLNSSSGGLTGVPTQAGSFTFTVRAADSLGCFGSGVYTIVINGTLCPVISLSPATLPNFVRGNPYSQSIIASGGMAPSTYTVSAGSLPAGIMLNAMSGQLSGTPTTLANVGFTITATDANGCLSALTYSSQVVGPPQIVPGPSTSFLLLLVGLLSIIGGLAMRRV